MRTIWRDGGRLREVELTALGGGRWRVEVDGETLELEVTAGPGGRLRLEEPGGTIAAEVTPSGTRRFVRLRHMDFVLDKEERGRGRAGRGAAHDGLETPMPGVVTRVLVVAGEAVSRGQPLVAVEAMKMEHVIRAPRDGRVKSLAARPGAMVSPGTALVELEG